MNAKRRHARSNRGRYDIWSFAVGENRQAILHNAEALVASAVRLLYFHCGEQLAAAIVAQMAEEQARAISHLRLVHGEPPTETKH